MPRKNYRQGDVYLFQVKALPEGTKKREDNRLALGEATGHAHFVINGDVYADANGNLFVKADPKTTLEHLNAAGKQADHAAIDIDPGTYRVVIQEEYQPEGWKKVVD